MRPYLQVIEERYNGRERDQTIYDNVYAIVNPIGFNGHNVIKTTIYKICRFLIENNIDITSIKILDVGCGKGTVTRLFAEFTGNPNNISGIDLSEYRIQSAQKFTQNIKYVLGDIVTGYEFKEKFRLITAFDVFMHFEKEEQINRALCNIYRSLDSKGFFVWFDSFAKDHFKCPLDAECNGFNSSQMEKFARDIGFIKVKQFTVYKNFFGKIHSLYLYNKLPYIVVKILEKVIPGYPGNYIMIFRK